MKTLIMLFVFVFPPLGFAETKFGTREVLLDNEKILMVRLVYPVGTESGMHTHMYANRTVYFIKGGKLELISKDKNEQIKILNVPDGKALYLSASTHNVKNIGNSEIVIIENEIK